VAHEHLEQQELGAGQREQALGAPGLVCAQVEAQILEGEDLGWAVFLLIAGPAQQRSHAREQLAQGEGLDEVVIGAGIEAGDAVIDLAAGGEHQHGRGVAALAQASADLQSVDPGHRDIEDHGAVGDGAQALEGLVSIDGLRHLVVFEGERPRERVLHCGLVVDDQYACLLGHGVRVGLLSG
jgi:hypothetical protein